MHIEQFVMAYAVEQDRLRAILPDGFASLRPVLRINAEIRTVDSENLYLEFNTAVEFDGKRGWLNIANWSGDRNAFPYARDGATMTLDAPFLRIAFTGVGIAGSCPAEKDNDGCFFLGARTVLRPPETIRSNKEFCDCTFAWRFTDADAHGVSMGKTLPAYPTAQKTVYPKQPFTVQNATAIPCEQVLGSYVVRFIR